MCIDDKRTEACVMRFAIGSVTKDSAVLHAVCHLDGFMILAWPIVGIS